MLALKYFLQHCNCTSFWYSSQRLVRVIINSTEMSSCTYKTSQSKTENLVQILGARKHEWVYGHIGAWTCYSSHHKFTFISRARGGSAVCPTFIIPPCCGRHLYCCAQRTAAHMENIPTNSMNKISPIITVTITISTQIQ